MTVTAAEMQLLRPKPVAVTIAWELRLGRCSCCSCSLPRKCGKTSHLLSMYQRQTHHCIYIYTSIYGVMYMYIYTHIFIFSVYIYIGTYISVCVYMYVPMISTAWYFCNTWQCLHKKGLYKQNSAGKALLNACAFVIANKNMMKI